MKTKHTPGPWTIDDRMAKDKNALTFWYSIRGDSNKTIAEVKGIHYGINNETAEANVKLMSEAPEMLDALFNLNNAVRGDTYENIKIALADAQAVIKKATD